MCFPKGDQMSFVLVWFEAPFKTKLASFHRSALILFSPLAIPTARYVITHMTRPSQ